MIQVRLSQRTLYRQRLRNLCGNLLSQLRRLQLLGLQGPDSRLTLQSGRLH